MPTETETFIIAATDRTKQAFDSINRNLERVSGTLGAFSGVMAVAAGGAILGAFVKSMAEAGAKLNEMSQRLGVSVERLSAFQFAAKMSGVSAESLEQGLSQISNSIQSALMDKTGDAARLFKILGVTLTDTEGKLRSSDEILQSLGRKFATMADGVVKTSIANDLLGKSGSQLIPVLNNLDATLEKAESLGVVVSTDFAKASAEFGDHLNEMEARMGKFSRMAVTPLIKRFNDLMDGMTNADARLAQFQPQPLKPLANRAPLEGAGAPILGNMSAAEAQKKLQEASQKLEADAVGKKLANAKLDEEAAKKEKKDRDVLERKLETLSQSLLTENERVIADFNDKESILKQSLDKKLILQEEFDAMQFALEEEKSKRLEEIERKRAGVSQLYRKRDFDSAKFFFGILATLMQTNSKKMFEIGKKAAIVETIISTYEGAQKAFTSLAKIPIFGPALGTAAATAAIAVGLARVQAIRAQQFDGGGGTGAGGAAGTFPASPNTGLPLTPPGLPAQQQQRTVTINVTGNVMSSQFVMEQVIPAIRDATDDADLILFSGTSRQAQEIRA